MSVREWTGVADPAKAARTALSNVPLPEPHLAGIAVGLVLQRLLPLRFGRFPLGRRTPAASRAAGVVSLAAGCGLVGWALASAAQTPLTRPDSLVTRGPYAYTRNPMYVGWSMVHLGVALLRRDAWMLAALPASALAVHRQVLREEAGLEAVFGGMYARYRAAVPRYVAHGRLGSPDIV